MSKEVIAHACQIPEMIIHAILKNAQEIETFSTY